MSDDILPQVGAVRETMDEEQGWCGFARLSSRRDIVCVVETPLGLQSLSVEPVHDYGEMSYLDLEYQGGVARCSRCSRIHRGFIYVWPVILVGLNWFIGGKVSKS